MDGQFFEENKVLCVSEAFVMKVLWDARYDISVPNIVQILRTEWGKEYSEAIIEDFVKRLKENGYVSLYKKGELTYVHTEKSEEDVRNDIQNLEKKLKCQKPFEKLLFILKGNRGIVLKRFEILKNIMEGDMSCKF